MPRSGLCADERGQVLGLLVGVLGLVLAGALVLGAIARGLGDRADAQRAADLAALAGARALHGAYPRLFEPPRRDGRPNGAHLERSAYLALGRRAAESTAHRNGADAVSVSFPAPDPVAPTRIRVTVALRIGGVGADVLAEAELAVGSATVTHDAGRGAYPGPYAYRQGRPMRPDVAAAFDRLAAAARVDGLDLIVTSAFRTDAEQAVLFAADPDPARVARPGTSLHRLGTELDLGPSSAYAWLAAHAGRFRFVQRYAHEPWHYGYALNAASRGASDPVGGDGAARRTVPDFVPARYAPLFARAAQRWNVSAALLAAQAFRESGFNPFARSPAGARGIAQFMPATARALGLRDPTDPAQAIDAQAHLMRDLLRRFGAVALALAAYNAGPGAVARCLCVPAIPETQAYVAAILGLLRGAGDSLGTSVGGLDVRLVR